MNRHFFHCALAIVLLGAACSPLPAPVAQTGGLATDAGPAGEITAEPSATGIPTATSTPSNAPDLSGETIPIIHLCDRTGAFSDAHASRIVAVERMVEAINSDGGIFGAQLDLHFADTTASADGARAAYARMIRTVGEGPIILVCDLVAEQAVAELAAEDEIPTLSPGVFAKPEGFLFGMDATPVEHLAFFLQDLRANWDERKPEGAGEEIRLAILTWPVELSGEPVSEELLMFGQAFGVEIVIEEEMEAEDDYNIFDLIYLVRETNANVIYTNARSFGLANLLNGLSNLGLRERFVVGAPAFVFDSQVSGNLADPEFAGGLYLTSAWAGWAESEHPGIQQAAELLGDNEQYADWGYLQMLAAVDLARRALEDAILAEGIENLSPENVLAALESLEDYPVMAGLFTVNYTDGRRSLPELRTWVVGAGQTELSPLGEYAAIPVLDN